MPLEVEAGHAAQLEHHALDDDAEGPADDLGVSVAQFQRRRDADGPHALGEPSGDAPEVGQLHAAQRLFLGLAGQQHADAAGRGVALGRPVRDLGQRLGRGDADRYGDPRPLQHCRPEEARVRLEPVLEAAEAEEGLVDRVDLQLAAEVRQDAHHPRRQVAVEGVVRATHHDAAAGVAVLHEVPGVAHDDPEGLGLVRAGDDAPVVVRQDHDRHAAQGGLEEPLAGGVEVVAVDERDRAGHRRQNGSSGRLRSTTNSAAESGVRKP